MLAILKKIYGVFRCIREFVLSLFFILFVMAFMTFVSLMSSSESDSKITEDKTFKGALLLNLDGYLADEHDEFGDFRRALKEELGGESEPEKISTFDVVRVIKKAGKDSAITGIVLDLGYFEGGDLASLEFVGKALQSFKKSKKPVIAVGEAYTQSQYFLASFADKIYLNKAGFVDLHGLSYSNLYFKSLFEKIEAVPHIFRVGTYKAAVEPLLRNEMSPEAKSNANLWLSAKWKNFTQTVANNRKISASEVLPAYEEYLQRYKSVKGDEAQYALKYKLVTELMSEQQMRAMLDKEFGDSKGKFSWIDFFEYRDYLTDRFNVSGDNRIAVINVEGEITWGGSTHETAGSDSVIKLLRKARENKNIKGVILRVNSPGGSALASHLISQEIEALRAEGKPVVTSMGGLAASGGYLIAALSDKIVASPNTLTGSIGIFGLSLSFENTAKKVGVSYDGIATSPLAVGSPFKTLPKEQAELQQISVENGYDQFLDVVSRGRKMSKEAVDKVAQGQVWLGEKALQIGLVDQLGDFDVAHRLVTDLINQQRAKEGKEAIQDFQTQWLVKKQKGFLGQLLGDFGLKLRSQLATSLGLPMLLPVQKSVDLLAKFNDPKQLYLYCLTCGTVK